ncbi:5-formyltetrahydrofolate cyclo-ligase [Cucumibacter marinus]|uniref:5-formyltetrahydrofolate cyclo-ligase n=1 Tax=Cucumibacter marinus TaxID=1121252 RepID=UPI000425206C|nr:5-formyltetrahydrofolate cyclo-ligase [Cucumibacter marinus]
MHDDERASSGDQDAHGASGGIDPLAWEEASAFRNAERERLYAERRALDGKARQTISAQIAENLESLLKLPDARTIALYWPIRGEPNLTGFMRKVHESGHRVVLPVVLEKRSPLAFHLWAPDAEMERGIWNIPVPRDTARAVPDIVIAPVVGFDDHGYRLGNGGGYYDRTLAGISADTLVIGVGYAFSRLPTIHPMPWDVPMDVMVLEDKIIDHRVD